MTAQKWLGYGAAFTIASGLSMVLASLIPGGAGWSASLVLPPDASVETTAVRLGTGIGGAVMAGWGLTMWSLVRGLARTPDASSLTVSDVGRAVLQGTLAWYLLDTVLTLVIGAYLNLVFNTMYLVVLAGPAFRMFRHRRHVPVRADAEASPYSS